MDSYEQQKEATASKVRFSISSQGDIRFDAEGVESWELPEAIAQVRKEGSEARRSHQQIQELQANNLLWMHITGAVFFTILAFCTTLTLARLVSTGQAQTQQLQEVK
jgi:hypothetical protein